ncbi:C2 domain family protein [Leishmania donovani]|uniref:C2 domain family protein n=1 Tax=Leishmania donovani TaxID=5661 RepID=A0A504XNY3_LEIDO|nr:C2 domain family protein [Leishmania donovani]
MATLKVTVHEARDLPIMDRATGLADPYVVVKLDDMEHTTDIAHLTRNPVWEHDVRFDTADLLVLQEDPLEIRVYDHDIISRDDIVGMVLLDCNSIIYRANPVVSGWFPLLDSGAGLHGDIRLTIRIKFHAAENPLAPALPERYVRRLDPRVAERLSSLAAAIPGGNGGHVQHANSNPRTNETSVSFSMVTSATGLNAATTQSSCVAPISSSGNHVASSEHSPRGLINEPCRISASGVNVNKKNVSVGLSTAGAGHHHHHHRRHRSTSRKLTGARRLSKAPWHAPSHSGGGGTFEAGTDVPSLAGASFSLANNNVSASTMSSSANFARYDPSVLFAGPSGATTTEAAVAMAAAAAVENSAMPLPLPSPALFPFLVEQDLDPLRAARVDHPTLAAEEEGIFVFSVWRLDPAVFRVESTHSMMEELIVKADPEHVRFTNLRSSRSINDARVIQLFKLSGKVRRQLARKVVELQCNAVLGYVEEFDMEPNGIIVRAYGTPCVVSHVKYVDQREMEALLRGKSRYIRSSMMAAYQEEFPGASMAAAPPRSHSPALPSYGLSPILSNGGVGGNVGGTSTPATPSGPTQSADLIALGNTMAALPLHLPTTNASSTPMAAHDHLLPPSMSACSSQLGTSAQQRQSDHAVAAASWASTPLSSKEAVAPTAVQSPRSTPETYARAMETGDGVDSSGVPLLSLDNGGGRAGLSAAAPASALAGALSANSTTHHHSQAALTLAKNAQCSSPPFSRSFVAPSVDATVPMLPDALVQQQPSHANLMMRSGPTDTAVATVAATPATAPPMTNALIAASGAAAGGGPPARVIISMLTVKDLPAGSIHHIGGYICARSVKIVSRVKSRQIISQERDAWWMELREELRANARAFHCNTVLGYEEETQYHEDVVLLSLYGTAVMLNMSAASLRAGPEHLFSWQKQRVASKRNCALLHLYEGSRRKGGLGFLAGEVGDLLMHHVCSICHNKPVPDVLLAACTLPVELNCETPPRLVQVAVSKPKANVKGVELAMAVSQALPFIEFALHKQLLFNLRLQQLNACFSLRVSIVVGHDAIIGMLTGSGCRLAGLPVPRLPRVTVVDQQIAHKESVVKLRDVIASRRRRRNTAHSSSSRSTSSSSSSSSCSSRPAAAAQDNVRGIGSTGTKASSAAFTRGRGNRGSSSPSRGPSRSPSEADALPSTTSGIESLHSSQSRDAAAAPAQKGHVAEVTIALSLCCDVISSMTDEDVYAPADEWRTTSGGVRTKARDYVVKIDDVEEADMMLGMVDTTNFEDGVLLTLPYVPDSANAFDWQERIVLYRRYSRASALPFGGGGGTGAAALMGSVNMSGGLSSYGATRSRSVLGASVMGSSGAYQNCSDPASAAAGGGDGMNAGGGAAAAGRMALTTRLLNEYCADAKRAFVHRACRMAMRTGQPLRLRVVNLRVEMMFVPNSADLQLRLEGCVMVASSAGARQLRQLEDRAFRVCMHYTMDQSNHGGGSAAGQRAAGATPIMAVNAVASGKASPYLRWKPNTPVLSPLMVDAASNNLVTTSLGGPAAAAAAAVQTASSQNSVLPSMPQPLAAYAANSMCGMLAMSSVLATVDSGPAYIDARRLFTTSNAPFSIPYVQDITVPPPRVWSGVATAVSEDTAAPVRHTSTYAEYRDSRGSRTNSLTRRWNAFVRATGQSIKSLENGRSLMSAGGTAGGPSSMTAAARDANYCNPAARLPKDISQLQMFIPVVLFTPLDYVAGRSIVRYLGRLSQHFIREDYDTDTGDGLNMFFQRAETEIVCVVQALVRLMGGNALLKHRIVYHEICDSDGSGRAFLFATVTGDVVQVSDTVYWGKHAQPQRQQKDGSARKNEKEIGESLQPEHDARSWDTSELWEM